MKLARASISFALALSLAACGGGGSAPPTSGTGGGSTPTPPPPTAQCSLASRQAWVKEVIDEWYLFPSLVDNTVNPSSFTSLQDYIDALVAPARAQSQDRFFTYITSIEEEEAFFNSGSSAGFGVRLGYDTTNNRVFVIEAFENAPALTANIDRGTEILAIGTTQASAQSVSTLMANGGPQAVIDALGPSTAGTSRYIQFRPAGGATTDTTIAKADYSLDPVSDRYGAKVIDDNGKKVGYVNLRTFINSADPDLRAAFQDFRNQGVTEVILDFRYNGGGLVSIAELMGDLMGQDKVGQVFSRTTLRSSKANLNEQRNFEAAGQAIAPTKIAIIGRSGTASASELVANAFIPYLGNNIALVGTNTFGKPVGQFGFDLAACDDRLRVVAFRTENRDGGGDYYTGLASVMPNTCSANDDIFKPLGDPTEASVATALDFLAGRPCTAISKAGQGVQAERPQREILQPDRPSAAQREVPGMF
ncbi:MAG: peptidase S41 [Sphingomonadaceae bacterium]|nr:peptidase S41 [Sphingomonadaceae bacterium]